SEAVVKFAQAHNGASVTSIKDKLKNCEASTKIAADAQTLLEDDVEEVDGEEQESEEEVEDNLAESVIDVLGDHSVGEVEFTTE
ncbi:MAG: hypothetical protein EBQ62_04530, partial [Alphaproteobacteria bacterium]|nr:hypothetical protein [Alphaproteobacteria bacterium]